MPVFMVMGNIVVMVNIIIDIDCSSLLWFSSYSIGKIYENFEFG